MSMGAPAGPLDSRDGHRRLSDNPLCRQWIGQFRASDRPVAREILDQLLLVSTRQFENGLRACISEIASRSASKRLAVLTITEAPAAHFSSRKTTPKRQPATSEGRIAQLLENMARSADVRIRANPTIESMRTEKVRHVVLVDDVVGTGQRVVDYWKNRFPKTIKSWISLKYVTLWLVAYSAEDAGVRFVRSKIRALERDNIVTSIPISPHRLTAPARAVCSAYGARTSKPNAALGFGESSSLVVFEHGCPNNCPAILWVSGEVWRPLFPDRGIPSGLTMEFGVKRRAPLADSLWASGQHKMAIALLDQLERGLVATEYWELAVFVGLQRRRKRLDLLWLAKRMRISRSELSAVVHRAVELKLYDPAIGRLTTFARDLADAIRSSRPRDERQRGLPTRVNPYYPLSCGGHRRFSTSSEGRP